MWPACLAVTHQGPGNVEFTLPVYTVDEYASFLQVRLRRIDDRLGTVGQDFSTSDRLAQAGFDYTSDKSTTTFNEWAYVAPRSVGSVGGWTSSRDSG